MTSWPFELQILRILPFIRNALVDQWVIVLQIGAETFSFERRLD
jgi:hypothetical protein